MLNKPKNIKTCDLWRTLLIGRREFFAKLANVRIHVERVIGLVRRKYTLLQNILPVETITTKPGEQLAAIDHIVKGCCALINCSDSMVL